MYKHNQNEQHILSVSIGKCYHYASWYLYGWNARKSTKTNKSWMQREMRKKNQKLIFFAKRAVLLQSRRCLFCTEYFCECKLQTVYHFWYNMNPISMEMIHARANSTANLNLSWDFDLNTNCESVLKPYICFVRCLSFER